MQIRLDGSDAAVQTEGGGLCQGAGRQSVSLMDSWGVRAWGWGGVRQLRAAVWGGNACGR